MYSRCIVPANKCLNAKKCWHFNIYELDKIHAQLSWAWKMFYNPETWIHSISFQLIVWKVF